MDEAVERCNWEQAIYGAVRPIDRELGLTDDLPRRIHLDHSASKSEREAPGAIIHAASFDDNGRAYVADVWESAEQLNAFVEGRLMPAFQKLNLTPPHVEVHPTHNINAHCAH